MNLNLTEMRALLHETTGDAQSLAKLDQAVCDLHCHIGEMSDALRIQAWNPLCVLLPDYVALVQRWKTAAILIDRLQKRRKTIATAISTPITRRIIL